MRVPMSWLRTLVPALTASADDVAAALVRAGLEVEQVHRYGDDVVSVVVGEVLDVEELTEFKKPIRYCHVDVGSRSHEVVCGATNFAAGDKVAFALPGASLPGGFQIATRQTYGHTSDGMICSEAELGLAEDSPGILVLDPASPLGVDVVEHLSLRDEVLDIAVTPDRGYTLSVRGVARETATAFGLELLDPGLAAGAPATEDGPRVTLEDPGCTRYVARVVTGLDPAAPSPAWLQRRLVLAGMRSISLAVDVTNHVMLELGQPLHAFDLDALQGGIVVRRATAGERPGDPRRQGPRAAPGRPRHRRRLRRGRAGRGHGRRRHRGHRHDDVAAPRERAVRPGVDRLHRTAPPAAERGVQALRARGRPRPGRGGRRVRRPAAGRARRCDRRARLRRRRPARSSPSCTSRSRRPSAWPAAPTTGTSSCGACRTSGARSPATATSSRWSRRRGGPT